MRQYLGQFVHDLLLSMTADGGVKSLVLTFNAGGLRKDRTVEIASKHMKEEIPYERKHDIADALCMILYHNFKISVHIFDQFKYSPKV